MVGAMNDEEAALVQKLWTVIKQERFRETLDDQAPEPHGSMEVLERRGDLIVATNGGGGSEFNCFFFVSSYQLTNTPYFKHLLRDWGKEAGAFKKAKRECRIGYVEITTDAWSDGLYGLLKLLHNQVITNTTPSMTLAVAMVADQMLCLDTACVQYYIKAALAGSPREPDTQNLVMYLVVAKLAADNTTFSAICQKIVMAEWDTADIRYWFASDAAAHLPDRTLEALMALRCTYYGYLTDLAFFNKLNGERCRDMEDPEDWTLTFRDEGETKYNTTSLSELVRVGHHHLSALFSGLRVDISTCKSFRVWLALRHQRSKPDGDEWKHNLFRDKVSTVCSVASRPHYVVCLSCLKDGWSRSAVHEPGTNTCVGLVANAKQAACDLDKCPERADWDYDEARKEMMCSASRRERRGK